MQARPFMDLCPQRSPSAAAAAGAVVAAGAGLVPGVRGSGPIDVPPTAAASRRLGPLALLRTYLASRIALWASSLLMVGSHP